VTRPRSSENGVSLVALMVAVTLMLVAMAVMLPSWDYVMKNEREEELLFRGYQIANAIQAYQSKERTPPPSLEILVKKRYLRRLYKDPMTKDGKWTLVTGIPLPGGQGVPPINPPSGGSGQTVVGPIAGVASRSTEKSIRTLNGKRRYSDWQFIPLLQQQREWRFLGGRARRVPLPTVPGAFPQSGPSRSPTPFGR
jgi:type II secretory pathway pseudopilin PulG